MTIIGYHASHEQFAPGALLDLVDQAEAAGFAAAKSSDHFHPWSERQGQSGFAWSWLGAAMHATSLPFGIISAPGYRYHQAILAQAAATIGEMFPGRFWLALGSGEAINEAIIGAMGRQTGTKRPAARMRGRHACPSGGGNRDASRAHHRGRGNAVHPSFRACSAFRCCGHTRDSGLGGRLVRWSSDYWR